MTSLSRRRALLGAAALAGAFPLPRGATAQQGGPFSLPPLPYAADANEPHIDAATMTIHHDRHHAGYVENLNAAVREHGRAAGLPLRELLARIGEMPEGVRTALRNNGGGHANHSMFWTVMGGRGGAPGGELGAAVARDLGGVERLRAEFNRRGGGVFGSGWVFVTVTREGALALATRPNQETPLMDGQMVLMGNDVWEHAYYLKYRNRRSEYLESWWNVVDWPAVERRYAAARAGRLEL